MNKGRSQLEAEVNCLYMLNGSFWQQREYEDDYFVHYQYVHKIADRICMNQVNAYQQ